MSFFNNVLHYCVKFGRYTGINLDNVDSTFYKFLFLINLILNLTAQVLVVLLFLYEGETMDILDASSALESGFILNHGLLKLVAFYVKRRSIAHLLANTKNLASTDFIKDKTVKSSCDGILKNLRRLFLCYASLATFAALISFILRPILSGGKYSALICYVPEKVPFAVATILEIYTYMITIHLSILVIDGVFFTQVTLILMQIKVLNHDLKVLFDENEKLKEGELNRKVGDWVERHITLLGLVEQMNEIFSMPILLYSGYITVGMCVEMYISSTQEQFNSGPYLVLAAVLFEYIVCYCIPSQMLTNEAEKIPEDAWANAWYKKPSSTVKTATRMIIMKSQETVGVTAIIFPLNLMTCLNTLRTMVSYYMFLKAMGSKDQ